MTYRCLIYCDIIIPKVLSNRVRYAILLTYFITLTGDADKMDGYIFSLAEYDDIPEIVGIYQSLIGTPGCTWDSEYPNRESAEYDLGNKSLYILKKDDKIIAVATAADYGELGHLPWAPEKPCELYRIGVVPTMQNQGVGTMILRNIIKTVEEKGFDGIRMIVSKTNPAALALYDKNGFERCGEVSMFDMDWYCYQIKLN